IERDLTTSSLRILFSAVPMWMLPLAYGGPSCSTNFGAPARRSRIFPYRSIACQRASVSGSLVGRFAFIGKSVRGRLTVSFHSGMGSVNFIMRSNESRSGGRKADDARQWPQSPNTRGAHRSARVGVVLVQSRLQG